MYKVIVKKRGSDFKCEGEFITYSAAYNLAQTFKTLGGDSVCVYIETDIQENKFTDHIMDRFTRRD